MKITKEIKMSKCNKCNPSMSGRTREYIKNSESYKNFLKEMDKERDLKKEKKEKKLGVE